METLIQGIFAGFGFCIGIAITLSVVILLIVKGSKFKKPMYDTKKLLKAFERYYDKEMQAENYHNMNELKYIVEKLERGLIPEEVFSYDIKKKSDIAIKENDETPIIKLIEKYVIVGKKMSK